MKTKELYEIIKRNGEKPLLFEYATGVLVGSNYHLTEVKNVIIESVDCGAVPHNWKETVLQLWENPLELGKATYMTCAKAGSIIDKVNGIRPIDMETEVKIEYGNKIFHTTQLNVRRVLETDRYVLVKLATEKTQCKAPDLCGTPEEEASSCCTPDSGCC
ncbi:DUF6428 family protein [Aureivirga sp. CE67]|uniref:DUF6428 family protein n=1 Tax=Aureivirga sp. CE67 TaxID=1788983 RepID=UPI0018CB3C28|nr:DUF6428 family protein [Aureivirga sp. CE67]